MGRGTDITDFKRVYRTVTKGEIPAELTIRFFDLQGLRYGENPNQPAFLGRLVGNGDSPSLAQLVNIRLAKTGKGGISATNFMDVARGLQILKYFSRPVVAVMKHNIPCGFEGTIDHGVGVSASRRSLEDQFTDAWHCDGRSAFGSIVVFNTSVTRATAEAMAGHYIEGVAAPEYEEGVMQILDKKKDLRVMLYSNIERLPKFEGDDTEGMYDIKMLPTGDAVIQKPYLSSIRSVKDLVVDPLVRFEDTAYFVERDPTPAELSDLLTAWYINIGVRSNGIVLVKDGVTRAVGSGQQERVGAVEQAVVKAFQKTMDREHIPYDPWFGIFGTSTDLKAMLDGARDAGRRGEIEERRPLAYERLKNHPLKGAVCSSDAFFPFGDSIETLGRFGVSAVIQPFGSIRDHEVIQAMNKYAMAAACTRERCFGHF